MNSKLFYYLNIYIYTILYYIILFYHDYYFSFRESLVQLIDKYNKKNKINFILLKV